MVYEFLLVHDKTPAELDFMLSCFLQPDILIKAFIKNQKAYHYLADRPFLSLAMDGLYIVVVTRTEDAVGTSRNMLLGIALFFSFCSCTFHKHHHCNMHYIITRKRCVSKGTLA